MTSTTESGGTNSVVKGLSLIVAVKEVVVPQAVMTGDVMIGWMEGSLGVVATGNARITEITEVEVGEKDIALLVSMMSLLQ